MNIYDAHCLMLGEGDNIVVLHPFPNEAFRRNLCVQQLVREFRVYLVSLPGMQEEIPDFPWTYAKYLEFFDELFKRKYIDSCRLIAVSMGASLGLPMTLRHPEMIHKLILVHPWGIYPVLPYSRFPLLKQLYRMSIMQKLSGKEQMQKFLPRLFHDESFSFGAYLPNIAFLKSTNWPKQVADMMIALGQKNRQTLNTMHRIKKPVLVIGGESDVILPAQALKAYEARLQSVQLTWVENAGHFGILEHPDVYFHKITQFL